MNILFITSTFPRFKNDGQAPFVLEQALAWKSKFAGDRVIVLAPHDDAARTREVIEGVEVRRFKYWWPTSHQALIYPAILPNIRKKRWPIIQIPALMVCEYLAARRLVREVGVDFVFAHWVMPQGVVAYLLHQFSGIPYGLKNYSSDIRVFSRLPILGPLLARLTIGSAQRLICENSLLRQEALAFFSGKARARVSEKIVALTMGVFHGIKAPPAFDATLATCDFAYIGRLSRKKGVDHFLRALAALREGGVSFSARIAGAGEEKEHLDVVNTVSDAEFVGHISGRQKIQFFAQARYFVFPSLSVQGDIEGLPVSLLEALYMGKVVIASRATNIHLLPEYEAIRSRILILEDPANITQFAGLLEELLSLPNDEVRRRVSATQNDTAVFGWDRRIEEYRQLLLPEEGSELGIAEPASCE